MAAAGTVKRDRMVSPSASVWITRAVIIVALLAAWETLAQSKILFEDVVPPLGMIGNALIALIGHGEFYTNLAVTAGEVCAAMVIGGAAGVFAGIVLGGSPFLGRAYEPFLYYLGPTPKIIFFPVMIMWFGLGTGSKVAMGAVSAFFPIALSTAAGMRGIDEILIRVGRSLRATRWQMASKIYIPAMAAPVLNGLRLGFGVAVIAVLLAETKLSNKGIGYLIIQAYQHFNMPEMYAMLIVVFTLAALINGIMENFSPAGGRGR